MKYAQPMAPASAIQLEDIEYVAALVARGITAQNIARITGFTIAAVREILAAVEAARPQEREAPKEAPSKPARDVIWIHRPRPAQQVLASVAAQHGVTRSELSGASRLARVVCARQHAMWELRQHTDLSLAQIGRLLGNRDHTTIIHGVRRHAERLEGQG